MTASIPPSRPSPDPWPSSEGHSFIEGVIRRSLKEQEAFQPMSPGPFTQDEHLAIARSGAADLSMEERDELVQQVEGKRLPYGTDRNPKPIPLFFGSWTGMNPFRFLKPFFIQKKPKGR